MTPQNPPNLFQNRVIFVKSSQCFLYPFSFPISGSPLYPIFIRTYQIYLVSMDLIHLNKPHTPSITRRSKSLANNLIITDQPQTPINHHRQKSIPKLIKHQNNQSNHKGYNMELQSKHNPQIFYPIEDAAVSNSAIRKKHIRLSKRKSKNLQTDQNGQMTDHTGKQVHEGCVLQGKEQETLRKIVEMSLKHHDPSLCVCAYCSCGRHICNVHIVKPYSSQKHTSYHTDYNKKEPAYNLKFKQSSGLKGQQRGVDPFSTYTKEYFAKHVQKEDQILPDHLLRVGGPFNGRSTYSSNHLQFSSVKTELMRPIGGKVLNCPFGGNTNYQKQYTPKQVRRIEQVKASDNMKLGEPWLGRTTYEDVFKTPSKGYTQKWKSNLTDVPPPKYENQYDTVYKTNYIPLKNTICAAIPELFARSKMPSCTKNPEAMKDVRRTVSLSKQTI